MRRHLVETTHGHVHVRVREGSGTPLLLSSPGLSSGGIYKRLADQLDEIGDRLEKTVRADPVGPVAQLHPGEQLALDPGEVGECE